MNKPTWDDIPDYIDCEDCGTRHFLTLNKDIYGKWCAAYTGILDDVDGCPVEHAQHSVTIIGINSCDSLDEIPQRLYYAIERYKKRNGYDHNEEIRKPL